MKNIPNENTPEDILYHIIRKYKSADYIVNIDYLDGGIDPLWSRFERVAINQFSEGDATLSRYAIWANTVRDNIVLALEKINEGNNHEAKRLLLRAANSLSAFSQLQSYFDPFKDN